jgi:retron-type reverse transcriptase
VTLDQFDEDLKDNLYRIWNRLSSGSYFPPPVSLDSIRRPRRLRGVVCGVVGVGVVGLVDGRSPAGE